MDRETREILKASPLGTIIVNLDGNRMYNTVSLKEFKIAIKNQERCIITPLTYALDNHYCLMGYKLIIESDTIFAVSFSFIHCTISFGIKVIKCLYFISFKSYTH